MLRKEDLLELIDKLKGSRKAIIVEGPNDRKALESLGIGNIFIGQCNNALHTFSGHGVNVVNFTY